jgi:hypothetical protein
MGISPILTRIFSRLKTGSFPVGPPELRIRAKRCAAPSDRIGLLEKIFRPRLKRDDVDHGDLFEDLTMEYRQ